MKTKPNQTENQKIRLNKLLARYGLCSRRKADEWIREGRVSVGGVVCRELGVQVDPRHTLIAVDGKPLENAPPHYYIALYKPIGYVTTRRDPQRRKTVLDLLPSIFITAGVFPAGRLDYDSEGL
ncbi:MAG: pseudouridine synthase, partial [Candidatus Hinthialibacter sp.]